MQRFCVSPGRPGFGRDFLGEFRLPAPNARDRHEYPDEPLVLVVSRERAAAVPMLQELLRGEPEISIVIDRRVGDRRDDDDPVANPPAERRVTERRRRFSFYLL
jgi:hypothetical protein